MDNQDRTFDVQTVRGAAARQKEDAEMIMNLADALEAMARENAKLRAQLAAIPTPKEDPHDRKE